MKGEHLDRYGKVFLWKSVKSYLTIYKMFTYLFVSLELFEEKRTCKWIYPLQYAEYMPE